MGRQSCGWDGRAAWSRAVSPTARRLPEIGPWRSRLAQAVLGQRRVGFDLVVVMSVVEHGRFDRMVDQERRDARRPPLVGSWRRATVSGQCVSPRAESPRLCESSRLNLT